MFQVCGALILGVSIWLMFNDDLEEYLEIIEFDRSNPYLKASLTILIIVGVFIFLVGFFGCCGACKESASLLKWVSATLGSKFYTLRDATQSPGKSAIFSSLKIAIPPSLPLLSLVSIFPADRCSVMIVAIFSFNFPKIRVYPPPSPYL